VSRVELSFELWGYFVATGGGAMLRAYYDEHRELRGLWKPHDPDHTTFSGLTANGNLYSVVARLRGKPVGLLMITVAQDLESKSFLMAQQGPWFTTKDPGVARLGLGLKMLDHARPKLHDLGVSEIELHHPLVGRGARLGRAFSRLGAVPCNQTYLLRL
jgi:hypothetical protein